MGWGKQVTMNELIQVGGMIGDDHIKLGLKGSLSLNKGKRRASLFDMNITYRKVPVSQDEEDNTRKITIQSSSEEKGTSNPEDQYDQEQGQTNGYQKESLEGLK